MATEAVTTTESIGGFVGTLDQEPWDYLSSVEQLGGVVWDDSMQAFLVSGHELLKELARQDNAMWRHVLQPSTDGRHSMGLTYDQLIAVEGGSARTLFLIDGDPHKRLHRWWVEALSPPVLETVFETVLRPTVREELDKVAFRGRAELVREFADPVAVKVSFGVIGLPVDDDFIHKALELHERRHRIFQLQGVPDADAEEIIADGLAACREMYDYFLPYVEERRDGTGQDFISMLWRDGRAAFGGDFDVADVMGNAWVCFDGSAGNIASGVAASLYLLIQRPELQDAVRDGGAEVVRRLNEEALRLYTPITFRYRFARQDTELGGVKIAEGQAVIALGSSANRDESRYRCPHDVDLERTSPRDHWAFQKGARACPAQSLTRVQMEIAVTAALDRLRDLRFDPEAPEPPRYAGMVLRRWEPLHALFTPSA